MGRKPPKHRLAKMAQKEINIESESKKKKSKKVEEKRVTEEAQN